MIRAFETSDIFHNVNTTLGLLTPAETRLDARHPRSYVMGICDWCGTKEIVDEEKLLYSGLNWVTWDNRTKHFCSRKCRAEVVQDGESTWSHG